MDTQAKLNAMFNKALKIADECGLKYGTITEIKINSRLTRTLGVCNPGPNETYWIEVNKNVLEKCNDDFIMETILHEIVHTCPGCWNHGKEFKETGMQITRKYPQFKITRTANAQAACADGIRFNPKEKYVLKCEKCKREFSYSRMTKAVKYPWAYRCKCGGDLVRIK